MFVKLEDVLLLIYTVFFVQLGMEFPQGARERRKVCIFAPNPNPQIPKVLLSECYTQKPIVVRIT